MRRWFVENGCINKRDKDKELLTDLCRAGSISNMHRQAQMKPAEFLRIHMIFVIINSPLADESGSELAIYISNTTCSGADVCKKRNSKPYLQG